MDPEARRRSVGLIYKETGKTVTFRNRRTPSVKFLLNPRVVKKVEFVTDPFEFFILDLVITKKIHDTNNKNIHETQLIIIHGWRNATPIGL